MNESIVASANAGKNVICNWEFNRICRVMVESFEGRIIIKIGHLLTVLQHDLGQFSSTSCLVLRVMFYITLVKAYFLTTQPRRLVFKQLLRDNILKFFPRFPFDQYMPHLTPQLMNSQNETKVNQSKGNQRRSTHCLSSKNVIF